MFELRIALTPAAVDLIKADLAKTLASVKSSHRIEAVARGLGFRTNAAMRAAMTTNLPLQAEVRWHPFASYLAEKGFAPEIAPFFHCCARVALNAVMQAHPRLTLWGIETGERERLPGGARETLEQYRALSAATRAELMKRDSIEQFLLSLALLAEVRATKTISDSSSYWVKHIAENFPCRYPHGATLGPAYVANGAVIAAAAHAGFIVREYPGSPNTGFNMSRRSLIDLDCRVRPNGPYAGVRRAKEVMRRERAPRAA
ncbi:MAG: hypothetical protein QOF14_5801 [Hyphomicrobiales bacterium]|jgi:hypothetical protein|nr:hypothetical protein [Hyphomicrobiales bacterium]